MARSRFCWIKMQRNQFCLARSFPGHGVSVSIRRSQNGLLHSCDAHIVPLYYYYYLYYCYLYYYYYCYYFCGCDVHKPNGRFRNEITSDKIIRGKNKNSNSSGRPAFYSISIAHSRVNIIIIITIINIIK